MYLRDYLHDIPLKALKSIAVKLNVIVEYNARIKLINAIDKAFWDGTLVNRFLNDISDDHRRMLSIIAFSEQRLKEIIDDLISLCLVGGIAGDDNIYFCPRGVAEQIRSILIKNIAPYPDKSQPVPASSPPNLREDIFSFLALTYTEEITLTLMGRIKKAFLERAFSGSPTCNNFRMHLSEDHRNTFVVEYVRKRELVSFDHRKARTTACARAVRV